MYDAIINALADLHEDYRDNATIYMRYADYVKILVFFQWNNKFL
ncbi:phage major capsid domain protein [Staphylococcus aureus]|nr:phage major capsid domain protein [Staphylococcus aureus]